MSKQKKIDFSLPFGTQKEQSEKETPKEEFLKETTNLTWENKDKYEIPIDMPFIIKLTQKDGTRSGYLGIDDNDWAKLYQEKEKAAVFHAKETEYWRQYHFFPGIIGTDKWLDYSFSNKYVGLYKKFGLDMAMWGFVKDQYKNYLVSSAQSRAHVPVVDSEGYIQMTKFYYPEGEVYQAEIISKYFVLK